MCGKLSEDKYSDEDLIRMIFNDSRAIYDRNRKVPTEFSQMITFSSSVWLVSFRLSFFYWARVAQSVEHWTFNPRIQGQVPARANIFNNKIKRTPIPHSTSKCWYRFSISIRNRFFCFFRFISRFFYVFKIWTFQHGICPNIFFPFLILYCFGLIIKANMAASAKDCYVKIPAWPFFYWAHWTIYTEPG